MRLKPYERYTPSEVMWFEQLPEHWQTFRFADKVFLKHGFQFRDTDFTDEGIKIVKITQLKADGSLDLSNCSFIDKDRLKSFRSIRIKEGDILMALTGGTIGKIIRINSLQEPILQNYRVGNFIPSNKSLNKEFLYYLLSSELTLFQIFYFINENGQPNIGKESFKNMIFPLPSIDEQKLIAKYLFTKTTAIDKAILLLETKTLYYKELSRTLINEAVCRGLNKNVPLKDSGIEWIGEIPKHWQVKRLKDVGYLYSGLSGKTGEHFNQEVSGNSQYYIPFTNIANNKYINHEALHSVLMEENERQNKVKKNDLFFLMSSEGYADIGKAALLIEDVKDTYLNSFCKGFRITKKSVVPKYLNYLLNSPAFRDKFIVQGKGFTRINLKMEKVSDFEFIIPPVEEQTAIAEHLDKKTTTIDAIVANIKLQIDSLKELRKTLINDVVTGKLKVTE